MELNKTKDKEKKPIDEILYLIKENHFDKEKIKKDLNIDIEVLKFYSEESAIIEFKGKEYIIKPESRKITFKDEEKLITKFIYSHTNLKEVINDLKFPAFNTSDIEVDSGDSLSSEILKIKQILKK